MCIFWERVLIFLTERHVLFTWSMTKWSIFWVYYTLPPTYSVFCTLPPLEFQNRAMYHPFFIIECNVYFLRDCYFFFTERHVPSLRTRAKGSIFLKTLTSLIFLHSSSSSLHFFSFIFPLWSILDKHLDICFLPIKRYHQGKVLVLLKFLSKNLQNCVMWVFQILDLGFFKKLGFFGCLVVIGGNHTKLKCFFPSFNSIFWRVWALTLKLDFQLLIAINPIMLNCGSCRFE